MTKGTTTGKKVLCENIFKVFVENYGMQQLLHNLAEVVEDHIKENKKMVWDGNKKYDERFAKMETLPEIAKKLRENYW